MPKTCLGKQHRRLWIPIKISDGFVSQPSQLNVVNTLPRHCSNLKSTSSPEWSSRRRIKNTKARKCFVTASCAPSLRLDIQNKVTLKGASCRTAMPPSKAKLSLHSWDGEWECEEQKTEKGQYLSHTQCISFKVVIHGFVNQPIVKVSPSCKAASYGLQSAKCSEISPQVIIMLITMFNFLHHFIEKKTCIMFVAYKV